MKKLLLYGAGDFGILVMNLLKKTDYNFAGFVSDISKGENIIGDFDFAKKNYSPDEFDIAITVGYGDLINRNSIYEKVINAGFNLPNIIHPSVRLDSTVKIGIGNIIMAGADVDFETEISDCVVIWPGNVISHNSKICNNVFISPNCTICGYVEIGTNTFVGAGSVIVDRVVVPQNTFIKAGSVYKSNIKK